MRDLVDLHTHTIASGHAYNSIMEMADAAEKKGLEIFGITDHAPMMPGSAHEIYFINFKAVDRSVFPIEVLLGVELNILDNEGNIDLPPRILDRQDVAIASFHLNLMAKGDEAYNTRAMIKAMENPYVDIIGHPDDGRFPVDYDAITTAAKETGKLLELNNSSIAPYASRTNGRENQIELLRMCHKKNVPVVMGSDAHFYTNVGNHTSVEELIDEVGFPRELVLNYFPDRLRPYLGKYKRK